MRKHAHARTAPRALALALVLSLAFAGVVVAYGFFQGKVDFELTCNSPQWEVGKIDIYNPGSSTVNGHIHWWDSGGETQQNFSVGPGQTIRRGLATAYDLIQAVVDAEGTSPPSPSLQVTKAANYCF